MADIISLEFFNRRFEQLNELRGHLIKRRIGIRLAD